MKATEDHHRRVAELTFASVYPHYCTKVLRHQRSLEELHQNIWPGQVVTDTAVRRTVSKLRQALEDTDPQNPRFIRSVMKRGYQFIQA